MTIQQRPAHDRELTRDAVDVAAAGERLARIERELARQQAAVETRIAALSGEIAALRETLRRDGVTPPAALAAAGATPDADAVVELEAALAERERLLAEVEAAARAKAAELTEALSAIEESVAWRLTGPFRAAAAALPEPLRLALFRVAKGLYWAATPHRMPERRRYQEYEPLLNRSVKRIASLSAETRERLGAPLRRAYGTGAVEQLDIYPTSRPDAPIFVFVHGGAWREGEARDYAFPAEMFVDAGAHYAALDFAALKETGGDLRVMADQVRRGIAWVYRNAAGFGGDPEQLYVGGHSSGGHLAAVALVGDWAKDFGLPPDTLKGGLLMSGVFDLAPVRRAKRNSHLRLTHEIEQAMSPQRHATLLRAPLTITCGGDEMPEFVQQNRDFVAALRVAGKTAELIEAVNFNHMDMLESLANPYGPNGRAALAMMRLAPFASGRR